MNQGRLLFQQSRFLSGSHRFIARSRYFTTGNHVQPKKKSLGRRIVNGAAMMTLATTVTVGAGGTILYQTSDQFRHVGNALERCGISGAVGVKVAFDYQRTLSREYPDESTYEEAKRACHKRCAERVLVAIQRLGGVYVKLGQHISVMQYLLPNEWCDTMRVLQDRCDATSPEDVRALFMSDFGVPVENLFEEFEWTPLGVASLAQVHRARLTRSAVELLKTEGQDWIDEEDRWVAVKLQHPYLDDYCQLDMDTVSFIFDIVKRVFPNFGFEWFAEEMRESIPKELDFVHETQNAVRVKENFAEDSLHNRTSLVIPRVIWAKRRIMCMECKCSNINKARVADF
jgi:aarF domain-containing kinase